SKLMVDQFSRAVLPHGTTTVVADPHEIANVLGTDGVHWLLDACDEVPLDVFVMAPSTVPASPLESPRRPFSLGDLAGLLRRHRTIGVAEMMNFPGVVAGRPSELGKLETGLTSHVDGHAPGVRGRALNAYIAAGIGSDHECSTYEEALEKRRLGMWIMLREGSAARNLVDLLPLVLERGPERCMFCTDDREPVFLVEEGHIDQMLRVAVEHGVSAEDALLVADSSRDLVKIAVVERHHATGRIGVGFVTNVGLKKGAFASTVAHDAHNVVVMGVDDADMLACVRRLAQIGGGVVVVEG